jgi:acyl carrier protein
MSMIEDQFLDIVRRNVRAPYRRAVRLDATLYDDLHLDSLGIITIMMAIEQETKLPVFDMDATLENIATIRDLMRLVIRAGSGKAR